MINRNQVSPVSSILKLLLLLPRWIESFVTGRSETDSVAFAGPMPPLPPTTRPPPRGGRGVALYWLDSFIDFMALERALILRTVAVQARGDLIRAFSDSLSIYVVIMAHVWLYWATDRTMPAGISYLDFNLSAFTIWPIFARTYQILSRQGVFPANVPLRIRWINMLVADCTWVFAKALVGMGAVFITFTLFPALYLTGIRTTPNIMLLLVLCVLASLFGIGFGLVMVTARTFWPLIEAVMEVVTWLMFVTSGVYEAYTMLPSQLAAIYSLNPLMTVVEWSRFALDPGYPVNGLDIAYPILFAVGLITLGLAMRRRSVQAKTP